MNITKHAKIALFSSTGLWALITLTVGALMQNRIQISRHFSYEILLEFAKAIDLWYIVCIFCAFSIDISNKKRR